MAKPLLALVLAASLLAAGAPTVAHAQRLVVVNGRMWKTLPARGYYEHATELRAHVLAAYADLSRRFDVVVIEGAGSVCELNLREADLVNLGLVTTIRAPWMLVADIERGGVFASVIGTLGLRYEPTVQTARFRPYVSGGLGLNHTEQELNIRIASAPEFADSISHSGFALSAGGGASIRLFSSIWANADAKYFRLSRDRNVIRFGGGVGVRF